MSRHAKPFDPAKAVSIREHEMTLEEIGEALGGLCRERVRQIELTALRKVRAACEAYGLRVDDVLDVWRSSPDMTHRSARGT